MVPFSVPVREITLAQDDLLLGCRMPLFSDQFGLSDRNIVSLPFLYLTRHVTQLGMRWRLQSPFLEHFSQAFARFFMRVGLPAAIPPYK